MDYCFLESPRSLWQLLILALLVVARGCVGEGLISEDRSMSKLPTFLGAPSEDLRVVAGLTGASAVKILAESINRSLGGGAVNMARAYQAAAAGPPTNLALLTGPLPLPIDPRDEFPLASCIECSPEHRTAVAILQPEGGESIIYHTRPRLDHRAAMAGVRSLLSSTSILSIAPLSADDFPLLDAVISEAKDRGVRNIYLQLSEAQTEVHENVLRTLRLLGPRDHLQLNDREASMLAHSPACEAIAILRAAGITATVTITFGANGSMTHQVNKGLIVTPGFDLGGQTNNVGPGDSFAGTVCYCLEIGLSSPDEWLPLAAAQGALVALGRPLESLRNLGKIAATSSRRSFIPSARVLPAHVIRREPKTAVAMVGGAKAQTRMLSPALATVAAVIAWGLVLIQIPAVLPIS